MEKPRVIVNCAASIDGKLALPSRKRIRISTEEDMQRVHRLRASVDAILVGVGTVLSDNPELTVNQRYVSSGENPVRIVVDSTLRTPSNARVLDSQAKTIIATTSSREGKPPCEVIVCGEERVNLQQLLSILYRKGIRNLLVEGGGEVIWSFLRERLVDELNVFVGNVVIGGRKAPTLADGEGARGKEDVIGMRLTRVKRMGEGVLLTYEVA